MTLNQARRAVPRVTPATRPFWDGARHDRLVIQRCGACRRYEHPPYPECTRCHSRDVRYEAVSGRGTVVARSIVSAPIVGDWEAAVPYGCFVVALEEDADALLAGNVVDADPYDVPVGTPVEVLFEPLGDDLKIPLFRVRAAG